MKATEISHLLAGVANESLAFADVLAFIEQHYTYTPVEFVNGDMTNPAGTNEGSAKVFSLAKLHGLNQIDTLSLFAEHYRAVLATPDGTDHANIRNFMHYGWHGFGLPTNALTPKA